MNYDIQFDNHHDHHARHHHEQERHHEQDFDDVQGCNSFCFMEVIGKVFLDIFEHIFHF